MAQAIVKRSIRKIVQNYVVIGLVVLTLMILFDVVWNQRKTVPGDEGIVAMTQDKPITDLLVPLKEETQARMNRVKYLKYEGRHETFLSEALVDLLGFATQCRIENSEEYGNNGRTQDRSILLVQSSPGRGELRKFIRETWASPGECRKHNVLVKFVMGRPAYHKEGEVLVEESKTFRDILVGNFTESPRASTVKALLGIRWALAFCDQMDYFVQTSDETFVWLDKLPTLLRSFQLEGNSNSILGARTNVSKVVRDPSSMFIVDNKVLDHEYYPPYCSISAGFIMPFALTRKHFEYAWTTPALVPFEDAFVGLTAEKFSWEIRNSFDFSLDNMKLADDACMLSDKFTAIAPSNWNKIQSIWDKLHDVQFMKECDKPDLDVIYKGRVADNAEYFQTVLQPVKTSPGVSCQGEDVFMIALISSHPSHQNARDMIRKTWGSTEVMDTLQVNVKLFFLIGQPNPPDPTARLALDVEHEQNHDILEGNFGDSFKNLTLKHLFGLSWTVDNCNNAKYFFKSDDDVFVNLRNVVSLLQEMTSRGQGLRRLYLGNGGIEIRTKNKKSRYYVESAEYGGKVFPQYCVGGGYILSMDVVVLALQEALRTPLMSSLDDVFIGILMKKLQVRMIYNKGFLYVKGKTDSCSLRDRQFMVMHVHGNVAELGEIWENFMDSDTQCE